MRTLLRRTPRRHLIALLVPCLLVAACGDDDGNGEGDGEASTVCDARDQLDSSLDALARVDVSAEGTNALESAVDDVGDDIDAVADAAGEEVDDEIDDVQAAFDEVETAISTFDEQESTSAAIASVTTAVTDLAQATGAVAEALAQECGNGGGAG